MATPLDAVLAEVTDELRRSLAGNLYSCCVYGSAVRGNTVDGVSDLNLLIVLEESNLAAHETITRVLSSYPQADPFIIPRTGFDRTVRCFASKFASIQRNYRVLHGADPLAAIQIDPQLEQLLCEQAVRNLRLRLSYAFVTHRDRVGYSRFLANSITTIFIQLTEILRLQGRDLPKDFAERIPIMEKTWPDSGPVLRDLLALREHPRLLADAERPAWHARVLAAIDAALRSIEQSWNLTPPTA